MDANPLEKTSASLGGPETSGGAFGSRKLKSKPCPLAENGMAGVTHEATRRSSLLLNVQGLHGIIAASRLYLHSEAMPRQSKRFPHGCLLRILKVAI